MSLADREALIQNPPFELTEYDVAVLRRPDSEYVRYTWEQLREVIEANTLDTLTRLPSDLANYIHFNYFTKQHFTSIIPYIVLYKLKWLPKTTDPASVLSLLPLPTRNPIPFADPEDYRILRNDWPYGTQKSISHLVVWLKTRTRVNEEGDPTAEARQLIEAFLDRTFRSRLPVGDNVMWFRNRTQWQSVRALEHFHVLVRGASEDLVQEWTGQKAEEMEVNLWADGKRLQPVD